MDGRRELRQRYAPLQHESSDSDGDGEAPVHARTRKPLDDSWASIGRDVVKLIQRLPEDISYLVNRLPNDIHQALNHTQHPKETCLVAFLVVVAVVWLVQNLQLMLPYLNLRQQLYGIHVHAHDSQDVIVQEPTDPYAFLDTLPRYISEDRPEQCSFRTQARYRKKLNHLSVRLGLGLPDHKLKADLKGRLGMELVGKEHPNAEMEYITYASTLFRGIPRAHQAHLDEFRILDGILTSCSLVFGDLHAVGDGEEHVASTKQKYSETFDHIHKEEAEAVRDELDELQLKTREHKTGLQRQKEKDKKAHTETWGT